MGLRSAVHGLLLLLALLPAQAAPPASGPAPVALFAIEFTTGPGWDPAKPPDQQPHFAAHAANLRRLRERGVIRIGARYGDKGLVVVAAESAAAARRLLDDDPSIAAGTFAFEVHPFMVFYPGSVDAAARR
jgi:uncharacterized protein YciI